MDPAATQAAAQAALTFPESLGISVLGFSIVFFVLVMLMLVINILRGVVSGMEAAKQAAAVPAAAPAAATAAVVAPAHHGMVPARGSLGEVKLYNVEDKTAALLMAIVADELKAPLNELRFISIREKK